MQKANKVNQSYNRHRNDKGVSACAALGAGLSSAFCGNVTARPAVSSLRAVMLNSEWNRVIPAKSICTCFWWWLFYRLSKGIGWTRLSKCSLKATAKEASSKIECRSHSVWGRWNQLINYPAAALLAECAPQLGLAVILTITHPAPNTRKTEHRCLCSLVSSKLQQWGSSESHLEN